MVKYVYPKWLEIKLAEEEIKDPLDLLVEKELKRKNETRNSAARGGHEIVFKKNILGKICRKSIYIINTFTN